MLALSEGLIKMPTQKDLEHLSTDQILQIFDEFMLVFEDLQKHTDCSNYLFDQTVRDVSEVIRLLPPLELLEPTILHHPLMRFIYEVFLTKFDKWCLPSSQLDYEEIDVILKISNILVHIAEHAPVTVTAADRQRRQYLLRTKEILDIVGQQTEEILQSQNADGWDPNINVLGLFTVYIMQNFPFELKLGRIDSQQSSCQ